MSKKTNPIRMVVGDLIRVTSAVGRPLKIGEVNFRPGELTGIVVVRSGDYYLIWWDTPVWKRMTTIRIEDYNMDIRTDAFSWLDTDEEKLSWLGYNITILSSAMERVLNSVLKLEEKYSAYLRSCPGSIPIFRPRLYSRNVPASGSRPNPLFNIP